ncbi:unnamed protein product (macronuclear) [Paramecium tetraurelia]|uniref:E2 ubiquitin-conjugating enzyme n=1 Tax=Paramecium tetraurelia TaxID=5888 RepID=A0C0C6_PARTE|nr:uncharacterized protein GSPATT00006096001 [Paramecium tetraurelia]CAK64243.1 unnamed protein product [Paramecium tetraurelia]|eukprot:XP_001431641.1 hypothetical protein (macronuclear) [Paramecium tetraurelia strain d4-2]
MSSISRIKKELQNLQDEPLNGFLISILDDNNLFHWKICFSGPQGSSYENGNFTLDVLFPEDYPLKSPKILFLTSIYHLNIDYNTGQICLEILGQNWSPNLTIRKLLLSILALLYDPNPNSPLLEDVNTIFKNDKAAYLQKAKEWTKKYAN